MVKPCSNIPSTSTFLYHLKRVQYSPMTPFTILSKRWKVSLTKIVMLTIRVNEPLTGNWIFESPLKVSIDRVKCHIFTSKNKKIFCNSFTSWLTWKLLLHGKATLFPVVSQGLHSGFFIKVELLRQNTNGQFEGHSRVQGVKCPTFSYFLGFVLLFPTFR